jgi:hypothetical protein
MKTCFPCSSDSVRFSPVLLFSPFALIAPAGWTSEFLRFINFYSVDRLFFTYIPFIMHGLTPSTFVCLLFALFSIQIAASAVPNAEAEAMILDARQASSNISCHEYATLSNLTAIGLNSTFRGAFIAASPDGTLTSENLLNDAAAQWTNEHLINDTTLNAACGNLSAIALQEAPKNFSQGIVGGFTIGAGARLGGGAGFTAAVTATMVAAAMMLL